MTDSTTHYIQGSDGQMKGSFSTDGRDTESIPAPAQPFTAVVKNAETNTNDSVAQAAKTFRAYTKEEAILLASRVVLKDTKCTRMNCTHSEPFEKRYHEVNGEVELIHKQKWHYCAYCGSHQSLEYIIGHEISCKSFRTSRQHCIEDGHTHSDGHACNLLKSENPNI